jgi:hypothetical protein
MSALRIGHLDFALLRERLAGRDVAIVAMVGRLRLASGKQLRRLYFPASGFATVETAARTARRVLARLTRDRLLVRLERRIGGVRAGSDGYVYALGPVGERLLGSVVRRPRWHALPTEKYVQHTVAAAQIVVDLLLAERRGELELLAWQAEPECWRRVPGLGGRLTLRTDLFAALGVGELELRWFIEVDRSSQSIPAILRKCRLYESYYRCGAEQAEHGVFPRVAWVTPDQPRAERLAEAITADRRLSKALFVVTAAEHALPTLVEVG